MGGGIMGDWKLPRRAVRATQKSVFDKMHKTEVDSNGLGPNVHTFVRRDMSSGEISVDYDPITKLARHSGTMEDVDQSIWMPKSIAHDLVQKIRKDFRK